MSDRTLLAVEDVTLRYSTATQIITATYRVRFDVRRGDRFVLLGPSGCGKSSLLKAVGGYLAPVEGRILLDGAPVIRPGPDRMMVFQEFDQLLPWKTVLDNVMFPLRKSRKLSKPESRERALTYLQKVKLTGFKDSYPHTLSGGMKQRVAIARAMAVQPAILLMDEPFAALDSLTRSQMQDELLELWEDTGLTLMFVTHSIGEALKIGNRVLLLSPHPGRVQAQLDDLSGDRRELEQSIYDSLFQPAATLATVA